MVEEKKLYPPDTEQLIQEIYTLAQRPMEHYLATGDDDFSFAIPGLSRFRVNAYRQRNSLAAVVRVVSFDIPKWEDIHIPAQVMDLSDITHGMILFTGTAGSGKSTTQACIIDRINHRYVEEPYSRVSFLQRANVDFNTLQSLFWNEVFQPGTNRPSSDAFSVATIVGGRPSMTFTDRILTYTFETDPSSRLLSKTSISTTSGGNLFFSASKSASAFRSLSRLVT